MYDARDAEDGRRYGAGDHDYLLAKYVPVIRDRVRVHVADRDAADDVVGEILARLWHEFSRGRRYSVPIRVVIHNVTTWTVKAFFERARRDRERTAPLEEEIPDAELEYEDPGLVEGLLDCLPPGDRAVAELWLLDDLGIEEIARQLGKTRNAVDQAIHRIRRRLRENLDG